SDRDLHITSAVMPVHDSKVMYRRPTIYLDGSPICILQDFQPVDAFYRENRLIAMSSEKGMGLDGNHTITLTLSYAEVAKLNGGEPIMVNPVGTGGRNPRKAA
ncbi:MAG: hypothetical protein IPG52_16920, partial [Rhodocyclaceae bacterium]|nr:hypothetical protein [Rhodocyclaceae bacterium]